MHLYHPSNHRLLDPTGITEGIAAAGVAVSIASTVASVSAARQQAANAQKADNYNAQVAGNDAQVAAWQATQQNQEYATQAFITQQSGAQDASRLEMQNGALVAKNVAAAAASGLTLSGSTSTAITGSAANNELATLHEQHKTQLQAYAEAIGESNATYNATIQSNRDLAQSGLYSMSGRQAMTSGQFNELGAGISGAASVLSSGSSLEKMFD